MQDVLALHRVTLWTVLGVLLGVVDAHLRRDLLPGRLISMAHRIRTSEIAIVVAFVLFCLRLPCSPSSSCAADGQSAKLEFA